jgi:hypothetical protein
MINIVKSFQNKREEKRKNIIAVKNKILWIEKIELLESEIRSELKNSRGFCAADYVSDKDRFYTDFYIDHINRRYQLQVELAKTDENDGYAEIKICEHRKDLFLYTTEDIKITRFNVDEKRNILKTIRTYKKEIELKDVFENK